MEFASSYNDINMNPEKSCILRLGKAKRSPISFNNIPTCSSAKYLGGIISNDVSDSLDIQRAICGLYGRTHQILHHNKNTLQNTSSKIKRIILNAYGSVYGLESFNNTTPSLRQAHRYMTMKLWPNFKYHQSNENYITSSKLYKIVAGGATSLDENYRKLRNNFILQSKNSSNPLVVDLIDNYRR